MGWWWFVGCVGATDPVAAMRSRPLVLTRHAVCRMGCRSIDEAAIPFPSEETTPPVTKIYLALGASDIRLPCLYHFLNFFKSAGVSME